MSILLELRKKKGATQQQVADYLGISRQIYANCEKGTKELTSTQLHNLAVYYDVTVNYLLGETPEMAKEKRLTELRKIVASYNPTDYTIFILYEIAVFIVGVILIFAVSYILSLVLIGFMAMPIFKFFDPAQKELGEKAEQAAILMHQCLQIEAFPDSSKSWESIQYKSYYENNNISLYNRFVNKFPKMQSEKLKKLSKIKFNRY